MGAAIEFCDVSFTYDGAVDVLDHLDLVINEGERVAVLGRNGSGKSTFARCVNALVVPDSGHVRIMGLDTREPNNVRRVRTLAGMVFQNPDDQMVTSVVADDVAFGPENLGLPQPMIARRVDDALQAVGMEEYALADPAELSGGQRQRVGIAGVLAMDPRIVVFDESTAMLDPKGRADMHAIMGRLHERGITVVEITHFMDDALGADRVVVLDKGRVVLDGTPDEVFAHAGELAGLGLDEPFAMRLAAALRDLGVDVGACARFEQVEEALCRLRSNG